MSKLIDLRDVLTFVEQVQPDQSSERQRTAAVKFYTWMFREAREGHLDIVFVCPHCSLNKGNCTCVQLGRKEPLHPGAWIYFVDPRFTTQWHIKVSSLTQIKPETLRSMPNTRWLTEFIDYLKQR
jgi:hypothetical protein